MHVVVRELNFLNCQYAMHVCFCGCGKLAVHLKQPLTITSKVVCAATCMVWQAARKKKSCHYIWVQHWVPPVHAALPICCRHRTDHTWHSTWTRNDDKNMAWMQGINILSHTCVPTKHTCRNHEQQLCPSNIVCHTVANVPTDV